MVDDCSSGMQLLEGPTGQRPHLTMRRALRIYLVLNQPLSMQVLACAHLFFHSFSIVPHRSPGLCRQLQTALPTVLARLKRMME
jgi:hypothetical protein